MSFRAYTPAELRLIRQIDIWTDWARECVNRASIHPANASYWLAEAKRFRDMVVDAERLLRSAVQIAVP